MNYKNLFFKKRLGQVFLLSILILSVIITSALLLATIFTKDLRRSTETAESVKAFYAADTVMELEIYNSINPRNKIRKDTLQMRNETEFDSENRFPYAIKTIGFSKGRQVSRGLEVYFGINE
jgi:hypothetical protein